jgi:hypothetical protein
VWSGRQEKKIKELVPVPNLSWLKGHSHEKVCEVIPSVADQGSVACLPQGSGIQDPDPGRFFQDPRSRTPDPKHNYKCTGNVKY